MDDLWSAIAGGEFLIGDGDTVDCVLDEGDAYLRFASSLPPEKEPMSMSDNWLGRRPRAGTRVAFHDSLEALMGYPDPPSPGLGNKVAEGTVVTVRTSSGDTTSGMMGA
jgi:hypothetical protein